MPRLPRLAFAGIPHRITQRGNCRQKNYFRAEDDRLYLQLLKDYARHHGVAVLSYCRMLNDIHFGQRGRANGVDDLVPLSGNSTYRLL